MTKVRVEVSDEYLRKQLKNPRQGLVELVDNALDADATRVEINLVRPQSSDLITKVIIRDNGEGMTEALARRVFGDFGNSWKTGAPRTRSGRRRRGSRGTGRWAAFSIGENVTWHSTTHPVINSDLSLDRDHLEGVRIVGAERTIGEFDVDRAPAANSTGTVVTVENVTPKGQQVDEMAYELTAEYALALTRQPDLTIVYDGHRLDPHDVVVRTYDIDLHVSPTTPEPADMAAPAEQATGDATSSADSESPLQARLRIVEWSKKAKNLRAPLVFTDAAGNGIHDHLDGVPRASWSYSAYLAWDGFLDQRAELGDDYGYTPKWTKEMNAITAAALGKLTDYVRTRRDAHRAQLVTAWMDDGSYPYVGQARGALEEAERDLFDVIAVTAAPVLEDMTPGARKFSLRLMREALTKDPTQLGTVLTEVLNLDDTQLGELHELLERTTLPALISAGNVITHRLDIINGLRQLLHDVDEAPNLLERDHLHKVVAEEPWLFGDEYTTAVNERSLTEVLRAHRRLLGSERVILDPDGGTDTDPNRAVLVDGRPGRVDLMLSRVSPLTAVSRQHLIVELKRPSTIGPDEVSQLEKYAFEIRHDSRFNGQDVRWDFVIIGTKLSDFAIDKAKQFEASATVEYRVRIMTWDDLLHNRLHQLNFVQAALNVTTNADTGMSRLRTIHGAHLPASVTGENESADATGT